MGAPDQVAIEVVGVVVARQAGPPRSDAAQRRQDRTAVDHDQQRLARVKVDEVVKNGKDPLHDLVTALPAEDARFQIADPQTLGRQHSVAGASAGLPTSQGPASTQ